MIPFPTVEIGGLKAGGPGVPPPAPGGGGGTISNPPGSTSNVWDVRLYDDNGPIRPVISHGPGLWGDCLVTNGNILNISQSQSSVGGGTQAVIGKNTGRWYCEIVVGGSGWVGSFVQGAGAICGVGLCPDQWPAIFASVASFGDPSIWFDPGYKGFGAFYSSIGEMRDDDAGVQSVTPPPFPTNAFLTFGNPGDIVMIAADLSAHKSWFGVNGSWNGSPDGAYSLALPDKILFPCANIYAPYVNNVAPFYASMTLLTQLTSLNYKPPSDFMPWQ